MKEICGITGKWTLSNSNGVKLHTRIYFSCLIKATCHQSTMLLGGLSEKQTFPNIIPSPGDENRLKETTCTRAHPGDRRCIASVRWRRLK